MTTAWYDLSKLPPPRPVLPRAVVTLAVGPQGRELNAITGPFLERYAARVKADYRVIRVAEPGPYPLAYKWAVASYLRVYERVYYVDADALVRPTCPDVFAAVPETHVGGVDEAADFRWQSPDSGAWWLDQVAALQRQLGAVECPHPFAFNAGVYVASRCHAEVFDPPPLDRPLELHFCSEQHLANERLFKGGVPVHRLHTAWNARWMWQREDVFAGSNYVVHLSGMPHAERVRRLTDEADRWAGAAAVGGIAARVLDQFERSAFPVEAV